MIKKVKATPYFVIEICRKCNVGEMQFTGKILTSYPTYYEHQCDNCSDTANYGEQYPVIRHFKDE